MIQFQLWMFPIMLLIMALITNRVVMWRLDASEKRWQREQERRAHQTPAE